MQTQRNHRVNKTHQLHIWNKSNVSKVNYQHIARRPPVCAVYISKIMHNSVKNRYKIALAHYEKSLYCYYYWCLMLLTTVIVADDDDDDDDDDRSLQDRAGHLSDANLFSRMI